MMCSPITILIADDDPDDRLLTEEALGAGTSPVDMRFVEDGEALLRYLRREDEYADPVDSPTPGVVLVDLNMPRMDGREAILEMKRDSRLRHIPVVVLSTSRAEMDVHHSYGIGASSYISKPSTLDDLSSAMAAFRRYWIDTVRLPQTIDPSGRSSPERP
jgi:two-component system response regulator